MSASLFASNLLRCLASHIIGEHVYKLIVDVASQIDNNQLVIADMKQNKFNRLPIFELT